MKLMNLFRMAVALFFVFSLADAQVVAQSTAFTYQGKLNANGIPAAGQTLQFTFTLYNAATGGAVVGTPVNQSILVGSSGLFTADLDFGQVFNGTQNWLDIQVGTAVDNEQELSSRQAINTVPVAQFALNTASPALQPFQANIYINIANGSSGGGDNGNVSPGTQTLLIPTGKRLVVQTVSVYRSGAISAASTQVFINASVNGAYTAFAVPPAPPSAASYSGTTLTGLFYADGGTELLANAFRTTTSGAETETVTVSGYLVDVP
jgi:hypothetical protein